MILPTIGLETAEIIPSLLHLKSFATCEGVGLWNIDKKNQLVNIPKGVEK